MGISIGLRSDRVTLTSGNSPRLAIRCAANRVNFRKEFFRVDLETIKAAVEERLNERRAVLESFTVDAEALQYRQSLTISDDDFEFLAKVAEATGIEDEDDDLEGADDVLPTDGN